MLPWASSSKFDCKFSWFSDIGVYYTIFEGESEGGKRGKIAAEGEFGGVLRGIFEEY